MLDTQRIAELKTEVGEDDFAEVADLFFEEVEEVLVALDGVDQAALPEKLHFLKGSARNIGLQHFGDLCLAEEERLKVNPGARPSVGVLWESYRASKQQLTG